MLSGNSYRHMSTTSHEDHEYHHEYRAKQVVGGSKRLQEARLRKQHAMVFEEGPVEEESWRHRFSARSARNRDKCKRVWLFLQADASAQPWAGRYAMFTAMLIIANVIADVLDSIPDFPFAEDNSSAFWFLERFTCAVFTVEYVLRLWSCVECGVLKTKAPLDMRLTYAMQALPALDALVLVVFYLDIILSSDRVRGLQAIRVMRLLALLKMERQTSSFATIISVLSRKQHELSATLFLAMVMLVVASTSMYYVENPYQPDKFSSIPATMWWAVAAMTTVGYGDIYPESPWGKLLGSVVAFMGLGLFALPSGIVSSGFMEVLEETRRAENDEIADMIDEEQAATLALRDDVSLLRQSVEAIRLLAEESHRVLEALRSKQLSHPPLPTTLPPSCTLPPSFTVVDQRQEPLPKRQGSKTSVSDVPLDSVPEGSEYLSPIRRGVSC